MAFEDLYAIVAEQREDLRWDRERLPEACPEDGYPLEESGGRYHCRAGHFVVKMLDRWTISNS